MFCLIVIFSGGWSGFAIINFKKPLGLHLGSDYGNLNPYHRDTMIFDGNIAHSSGFYWANSGCAGCMYAGGELYWDYNFSSYVYFTAREAHDTIDSGLCQHLFFLVCFFFFSIFKENTTY